MTDNLLGDRSFVLPEEYEQMNRFEGFGRLIGPLYQTKPGIDPSRRAFLVSDLHTNGRGSCHGGMLMAFADMAFGDAITMAVHRYWATIRLLTDFVSPAEVGEWIEGSSEIVGLEDDIYTVRGRIWSGKKTIMTGTGIFKALGERPKGKA